MSVRQVNACNDGLASAADELRRRLSSLRPCVLSNSAISLSDRGVNRNFSSRSIMRWPHERSFLFLLATIHAAYASSGVRKKPRCTPLPSIIIFACHSFPHFCKYAPLYPFFSFTSFRFNHRSSSWLPFLCATYRGGHSPRIQSQAKRLALNQVEQDVGHGSELLWKIAQLWQQKRFQPNDNHGHSLFRY